MQQSMCSGPLNGSHVGGPPGRKMPALPFIRSWKWCHIKFLSMTYSFVQHRNWPKIGGLSLVLGPIPWNTCNSHHLNAFSTKNVNWFLGFPVGDKQPGTLQASSLVSGCQPSLILPQASSGEELRVERRRLVILSYVPHLKEFHVVFSKNYKLNNGTKFHY